MSRPAKPLGVMTDAQQQLVVDNLKLVHFIIERYYPNFHTDDEIVSTATFGLCQASLTWDESKCKFSSYACTCIRNAIRNEFRDRCKRIQTISLTTPVGDDEKLKLEDIIGEEDDIEYLANYTFMNILTPTERVVYDLRAKGHSVEEIEEITGYNHRKVKRVMRLCKRKYLKFNR